jgi:hypothetical protein
MVLRLEQAAFRLPWLLSSHILLSSLGASMGHPMGMHPSVLQPNQLPIMHMLGEDWKLKIVGAELHVCTDDVWLRAYRPPIRYSMDWSMYDHNISVASISSSCCYLPCQFPASPEWVCGSRLAAAAAAASTTQQQPSAARVCMRAYIRPSKYAHACCDGRPNERCCMTRRRTANATSTTWYDHCSWIWLNQDVNTCHRCHQSLLHAYGRSS